MNAILDKAHKILSMKISSACAEPFEKVKYVLSACQHVGRTMLISSEMCELLEWVALVALTILSFR